MDQTGNADTLTFGFTDAVIGAVAAGIRNYHKRLLQRF